MRGQFTLSPVQKDNRDKLYAHFKSAFCVGINTAAYFCPRHCQLPAIHVDRQRFNPFLIARPFAAKTGTQRAIVPHYTSSQHVYLHATAVANASQGHPPVFFSNPVQIRSPLSHFNPNDCIHLLQTLPSLTSRLSARSQPFPRKITRLIQLCRHLLSSRLCHRHYDLGNCLPHQELLSSAWHKNCPV